MMLHVDPFWLDMFSRVTALVFAVVAMVCAFKGNYSAAAYHAAIAAWLKP